MALALRKLGEPGSGTLVPINDTLLVGRDAPPPGNLMGDHTISRRHARFWPHGETEAIVEDLGSVNTVQVNGEPITGPTHLRVGDRVTLGATTMQVDQVPSPASAAAPPKQSAPPDTVRTAIPVPGLQPGGPTSSAAPPSAPPSPAAPVRTLASPAASVPASAIGVPPPSWLQIGATPPTARRRNGRAVFAVIAALVLIAGSFALGFAVGTDKGTTTPAQAGNIPGGGNSADAHPSAACLPADSGRSGPGHFRFNTSACENGTTEVTAFTLPVHKGISNGQTVWYVIMDTSNQAISDRLGVNFAPKLANARRTAGVQKISVDAGGTVHFPGTVNFGHKRVLVPGPNGFPLAANARAPSVGDSLYSPLIEMPDGTVENAPQIANGSGKADKVLNLDTVGMKVLFRAQSGFYENKAVHYASFDSSDLTVAAIEDVTFAPRLKAIPKPNDEQLKTSAREMLIAFINGPSGPSGQGVNFALKTGGPNPSPKNLLHETPMLPLHDDVGGLMYTPMWDVHLAEWTQEAIDSGARTQFRDVNTILDQLVKKQPDGPAAVTGPDGAPFGAANIIVNCPLVSIDIP